MRPPIRPLIRPLNRPLTPMRASIAVILAVVLTTAIGAVVITVRAAVVTDGSEATGGSVDSPGQSTASAAPVPTVEMLLKPGQDNVSLPEPTAYRDGLAAGFPGTDLGAIATDVALTQSQYGFDDHQAAAAATHFAAPEAATELRARALAAVEQRREQAALPAAGPAPAPAAYAMTPIAAAVDTLDADESGDGGATATSTATVIVHVLSYVTLTTADNQVRDHLYAGTQVLEWTGTQWQVTAPTADVTDGIDTPQPADPGTEQFTTAGWTSLQPAR